MWLHFTTQSGDQTEAYILQFILCSMYILIATDWLSSQNTGREGNRLMYDESLRHLI